MLVSIHLVYSHISPIRSINQIFFTVFIDPILSRDAITPDQDFIISPHPSCRNFFMATGGSFHAWKFLPILGKYVVQMLDDRLDPALAQRWSWNREFPATAANERMMPVQELRDLASNEVS